MPDPSTCHTCKRAGNKGRLRVPASALPGEHGSSPYPRCSPKESVHHTGETAVALKSVRGQVRLRYWQAVAGTGAGFLSQRSVRREPGFVSIAVRGRDSTPWSKG